MLRRTRNGWLVLAGCVVLVMAPEPLPDTPAVRLWQTGQDAMLQGQPDKALDHFRQSLDADPTLARNWLSMAAAYLEKADDRQAALCLSRYLVLQPDHYIVRTHYCELLCRLKQPAEARRQLERFVADIQDHDALAGQHLASAHGRLMEMAAAANDDYGEHLHRGIGLYCLACRNELFAAPDGPISREGLLCRAAGELALATQERPDLARPCWYLHCVWAALAQHHPATRWLRATESNASSGDLTATERRRLELACSRWQTEALRR
jgi:tetratricopeptide (TPR) repeat protein